MQKALRGAIVVAAFGALLVACGGDEDAGSGLTVKLINTGSIAVVGFHAVPAGTLADSTWLTADWGLNLLPVASLTQWQFVMLPDFPRRNFDCVAAFDAGAALEPLKWNVPADWIKDAEYLTIHMGREDANNWSDGHQFGLDNYPGEVDVTPP